MMLLAALVFAAAPVGGGGGRTPPPPLRPGPAKLHGDPGREYRFWVYPKSKKLVDKRWDTHQHPSSFCSKYRVVRRLDTGVFECQCLGHLEKWSVARTRLVLGAAVLLGTASAVIASVVKPSRAEVSRVVKSSTVWMLAATGVAATILVPSNAMAMGVESIYIGHKLTLAPHFNRFFWIFDPRFYTWSKYIAESTLNAAAVEVYSTALFAMPLGMMQCLAFRFCQPWWQRAMVALGGFNMVVPTLVTFVRKMKLEEQLEMEIGM